MALLNTNIWRPTKPNKFITLKKGNESDGKLDTHVERMEKLGCHVAAREYTEKSAKHCLEIFRQNHESQIVPDPVNPDYDKLV